MHTYQKFRYGLGEKLELRASGERPPPRGFFAVNAIRIALIGSKLAQSGEFTMLEEELQARREKDMVHACARYGTLVNTQARSVPENLDEARRNQIRAAQAIRDTSVYGDDSIFSGIFIKIVLRLN